MSIKRVKFVDLLEQSLEYSKLCSGQEPILRPVSTKAAVSQSSLGIRAETEPNFL